MKVNRILMILGKLLFVTIFLSSGINKMFNFSGTAQYMESAGMPVAALFLIGAIILEVAGALMILFNYKAEFGALLLVVFIVPATLLFHLELSDQMQMIMFMKNVSITGGLIMYGLYKYEDQRSEK